MIVRDVDADADTASVTCQDDCRVSLRRSGGLELPLNTFLFQEMQRLDFVIRKVGVSVRLRIQREC